MKHIKRINEFFDSEDLKSKMEIPYLKGEIPFKDMVSDININRDKDNLLFKLIVDCSFIRYLGYKRLSKNMIQFGFQHSMNFGYGNDVFLYYVIEIVEHSSTKSYICNVYAKCIGNGQVLFDEHVNKPIMPYEKLKSFLNGEALDILINFTKFTNSTFNWSHFPFVRRSDMNRFNTDIN